MILVNKAIYLLAQASARVNIGLLELRFILSVGFEEGFPVTAARFALSASFDKISRASLTCSTFLRGSLNFT